MIFETWKDDYGLVYEPNYCKGTEADCRAAFQAGAASRDAEIESLRQKLASRDAEVAELKELVRLIFESTPPYREDGTCVFSDSVIEKWKELLP